MLSSSSPSVNNRAVPVKSCIFRGSFDGQIKQNAWGEHVQKQNFYSLEDYYGFVRIGDIINVGCQDVEDCFEIPLEDFTKEDLIFLDTETTGLSGGMGTVPFVIGLGFFQGNQLVIKQYVMRDFDEEASMLHDLADEIHERRVLVSFNGKAFDWPLLESRMMYHRIPCTALGELHIDLLYPSRRIWKNKLDSCSLHFLESGILKEEREDDIPGALIPSVYFQYLNDRDEAKMKRILKHNEKDILAMVALLIHIVRLYKDSSDEMKDPYELLSFARIFESRDIDRSISIYEKCIKISDKPELVKEARKKLSLLYKRKKEYNYAVAQWEILSSRKDNMSILPLVELAKYYEHQAKDYDRALSCVNKAIDILLKRPHGQMLSIKLNEIQHRKNRLLRKKGKKEKLCQ